MPIVLCVPAGSAAGDPSTVCLPPGAAQVPGWGGSAPPPAPSAPPWPRPLNSRPAPPRPSQVQSEVRQPRAQSIPHLRSGRRLQRAAVQRRDPSGGQAWKPATLGAFTLSGSG